MSRPRQFLPLVSVIIPCYRQAHLLGQAVDSVLAQTYTKTEVVVVNDGSDDDTAAVAAGYGSRIVYVSQPNRGPSVARNAGVLAARGEFLNFLDADDLLHPEAITRLVEATGGRPDCVGVGGYERFRTDPALDGDPPHVPPPMTRFFPWLLSNCQAIHAHIVPRVLFDRVGGFDATYRLATEDYQFWLRVALLDPAVAVVPQVVAYYRYTAGSRSEDPERVLDTMCAAYASFCERAVQAPGFVAQWGGEMLTMLYALRRKLYARRRAGVSDSPAGRAIAALRAAGARIPGLSLRAAYDRLPAGAQPVVDRLALVLIRWVKPALYRRFFES